jgi:hypothetical protein
MLGRSPIGFATVTLITAQGERAVPLGDIRWIDDAHTGESIGGPW